MKKSDLKKYAKLIVNVGANVQENQEVVISANVNDAYFIPYLVEECYKAKAKRVIVEWSSQPVSKLAYQYESVEALSEIPNWKIEKMKYAAEKLPVMIHVGSFDPDGMKGISNDKMMAVRRSGAVFKPYRDQMDGKYQWTIAALAGEAWAKKVYPNLSKKDAVKKLWDEIFKCARVYGDPIKNWDEHNKDLVGRSLKLDQMNIKTLKYKASNGTDFSIDLIPGTHFIGGGETSKQNIFYNPNMPTEECFNTPNKHTANGVLMASKPLSVMGRVVSDFGFKFKDGKVVEILANNILDQKSLESLINIDEGAKMLGEVALVPFDSPVNQSGVLFYNTLFDENACCHFALGRGFTENINDYQTKSEEEIKKYDINESLVHCDFMIGTSDLSITAITNDGEEIAIFKDGTWAF